MIPEEMQEALRRVFSGPDRDRCARGVELGLFLADDLPAAEQTEFAAHLKSCDDCRGDLALFNEMEPDWEKPPEDAPLPKTIGPAERWRILAWPRWLALGAVAAALVLVIVPQPDEPTSGIRSKGTAQLHVAAQRGGRTFIVKDGMELLAGDWVGFFYTVETSSFLLILHMDAQGVSTRLVSDGAGQSLSISPGREVRLDDGGVLSESDGGCEWFVGVFSDAPLPAKEVEETLRQAVLQSQRCALAKVALENTKLQIIGVER